MAQNFGKLSLISITHSHKFEVDVARQSNLKNRGAFVDGEKFSPVSGLVFQLRILNRDDSRLSISVKNCGIGSVKILTFEVKCDPCPFIAKAERNNFTLLADGVMVLPDLFFGDFYAHTFDGSVAYKDFRCTMEIEAPEGNQITGLSVTS